MVSHEFRAVTSLRAFVTILGVALLASHTWGQEREKRFYPDDPLLREPVPRSVKNIKARHVDETYDFLYNSFAVQHREGKATRRGPRPALDVNTLGDVPDSPWYTNRHFTRRMSIEELKRGPGNSTPPSAKGAWRVVAAKSDGATPGFVIEDEHNNRYVLKLDPPLYPELASAADVIGSKFFYAVGYNTPENYIVRFQRERLEIGGGATWRDAAGMKRPFTQRVLDEMLRLQPTGPDGRYRGVASRWIAGQLIGQFLYEGMRTDDPNDIIPHEDRRVLRGLRVFAAWLNHQDTRSLNTMDSLVTDGDIQYVKHYLMDFGSILGSNATTPKEPWSGNEYAIDNKGALVQIATLGFYPPRWARANYPKIRGVGLFDSWSLDPISWKPTYPNPAFLRMDREDAFWAAKQVAAFSDADIRAIVEAGEYSDSRAVEWITECLIKRRDKVVEEWFSQILPLDKFQVVDGKLKFEDLGESRGNRKARQYAVRWAVCDGNGRATPLLNATGTQVPAFGRTTAYLAATVECAGAGVCGKPITVYVRQGQMGLEVVGIDR